MWKAVGSEGTAFSKRVYVQKKYQESAAVFTTAYDAFVKEAVRLVPKPAGAEYPYWAFPDFRELDVSGGGRVMELIVPLDDVILFDRFDWYKVLQLSYLGETEEEEKAFAEKLKLYGIRHSTDVMLTPFYPELKREITDSWQNLFRHNDALKNGDLSKVRSVQASLWCIKKEWFSDPALFVPGGKESGQ